MQWSLNSISHFEAIILSSSRPARNLGAMRHSAPPSCVILTYLTGWLLDVAAISHILCLTIAIFISTMFYFICKPTILIYFSYKLYFMFCIYITVALKFIGDISMFLFVTSSC